MSKEKVDAYREAKKNRKENIEKEKRAKNVQKMMGWLFVSILKKLTINAKLIE